MHPTESKKLIHLLVAKADPKKAIKPQLAQLFVYCNLNQQVYLSEGWQGKVLSWIQAPAPRDIVEKKILSVFTTAFETLKTEDPETLRKLPPAIGIELIPQRLPKPFPSETVELNNIRQAQQAQKASQEAHQIKSSEELKSHSLVHKEGTPAVASSLFDSFFGMENQRPVETLQFIEDYLAAHPQSAVPGLQEKLALIRESVALDATMIREWASLPSPERNQRISQLSRDLYRTAQNLGPGQRKGVLASYGPRRHTLQGLLQIFRLLPSEARKTLPSGLRQLISDGNEIKPQALAAQLVQDLLKGCKSRLADGASLPKQSIPGLFSNPERTLPPSLKRLLPEIAASFAEQFLQKGITGHAADWMPPSLLKDFLEEIAAHGDQLPEDALPLLNKFEEKLVEKMQRILERNEEALDSMAESWAQQIQGTLPSFLLSLGGLDKILDSGPLWLEIEKSPNGLFDVAVHATGNALQRHLKDKHGRSYRTLRLANIKPEALSQDFFIVLLKNHLEALLEPSKAVQSRDLYTGLLASLEGELQPNRPDDPVEPQGGLSNQGQLFQSLLFSSPQIDFSTRVLAGYAHSFVQPQSGRIEIPTKEDAQRLEKGLQIVQADLEKSGLAAGAKRQSIDATLQEIREALEINRENTPALAQAHLQKELDVLKSQVNSLLNSLGLSSGFLEAWRGTVRWALGDEMGDLIDLIALKSKGILPEKTSALPQKSEAGWMLQSICSIYRELVYRALEIALSLSGITRGGKSWLLTLPLARRLLPYILPSELYAWYKEVENGILRILAQLLVKTVWKCCVNTLARKRLEDLSKKYQEAAKNAKDILEGNQPLSFSIPPQPAIPPPLASQASLYASKVLCIAKRFEEESTGIDSNLWMPNHALAEVPADPARLSDVLQAWHMNFRENGPLLARRILELEIPQGPSIWDTLPYPEDYMSKLHEFSFKLLRSHRSLTPATLILCLYSLTAILKRLAARCDVQIPLNVYPLLNWYRNLGTRLDKPEELKKMREIAASLLPGVDFDHPPSAEEIEKASWNSFFAYAEEIEKASWNSFFTYRSKDPIKISQNSSAWWKKVAPKEIEYLQKRLLELEKENWFEKAAFPPNLTQEQKIYILFKESMHEDTEEAFLPLPYVILRSQVLLSNYFVSTHQSPFDLHYPHSMRPSWRETLQADMAHPSHPYFFQKDCKHCWKSYDEAKRHPLELTLRAYPVNKAKRKTQHEIMEATETTLIRRKEMILCELSEQIVQMVNFYQNTPGLDELLLNCDDLANFLFRPGLLPAFFAASKDNARMLSQFFDYLETFHLRTDQEWIYLKIADLRIRAARFAFDDFLPPSFFDRLKNAPFSLDHYSLKERLRWSLLALTLGEDKNSLSETQKKELTHYFARALGHQRNSKADTLGVEARFTQCLQQHFGSLIKLMERDRAFRAEVLDEALSERGYRAALSSKDSWEIQKDFEFVRGSIRYDMLNNSVIAPIPRQPDWKRTISESEQAKEIFVRSEYDCEEVKDNQYLLVCDGPPFAAGRYTVHCEQIQGEEVALTFIKHEEGTDYLLIKPSQELADTFEAFQKNDQDSRKTKYFWMEQTSSSIKTFFSPGGKNRYKWDFKSNKVTPLEPPRVDPKAFETGLASLKRFCPLNKMEVRAFPESPLMMSLKLNGFGFTIKTLSEGEARAYSNDFAGYTIAPIQKHPSLNKFASYLLLENDSGQKKVILPGQQYATAYLTRFAGKAGPFEHLLMDRLGQSDLNPSFLNKLFYDYDLVEEGPETFVWRSQCPNALAYLMNLQLFQGAIEEAEKTWEALEWLLNSRPMEANLWEQLFPLAALVHASHETTYFRMRFSAALALNEKLRRDETPKVDKHQIPYALVIAAVLLRDLEQVRKNPDPRRPLSRLQEYSIYECAFTLLADTLALSADLYQTLQDLKLFKLPSLNKQTFAHLNKQALKEWFAEDPSIHDRVQFLRSELGLYGSTLHSKFGVAKAFFQASSDLPVFNAEAPKQLTSKAPWDETGGFIQTLLDCGTAKMKSWISAKDSLDLEGLSKAMEPSIHSTPPLDALLFNPGLIKTYFISYYAIARGESPFKSEDQKRLSRLLQLFKGSGDATSQLLMKLLEGVFNHPTRCEASTVLRDCHRSWHGVQSLEKFFSKLIDQMSGDAFVRNFLEPLAAYALNYAWAGNLFGRTLGSLGVSNWGLKAALKTARDLGLSAYINRTKPLWEADRRPGKGLFTNSQNAALAAGKAFAGAAALSVALKPIAAIGPAVFSAASSANSSGFVAAAALGLAGTAAVKYGIAKAMHRSIALSEMIPWLLTPPAKLAVKSYRAYQIFNEQPAPRPKREPLPPKTAGIVPGFSALEAWDQQFNNLLKGVFESLFSPVPETPADYQISPLTFVNLPSPVAEEKFNYVNQSIQAYYNQPARRQQRYRVQNTGNLLLLYADLKALQQITMDSVAAQTTGLLEVFNPLDKKGAKHLSLADLSRLVETGDLGEVGQKLYLDAAVIPELIVALSRIAHQKTRLYQLEKVLASMEKAMRHPHEMIKSFETLAHELCKTTAFSFRKTPPRIARKMIQFQEGARAMLYESQAAKTATVLEHAAGNIVHEDLMGRGKTWAHNPITAAYLSLPGKVVLPVFSKSLAGDQMGIFHRQMRDYFQKMTYAMHWHREMPLQESNLEALQAIIQSSIDEAGIIQLTKEDALAPMLLLRDRLFGFIHHNQFSKQEILYLKNIRKLLRLRSEVVADEAHEMYARRHRLSYPVGSHKILSWNRYKVVEATMRCIMRHPLIAERVRNNTLWTLSSDVYEKTLKREFAQHMSSYRGLGNLTPSQKGEFAAYICDETNATPAWIQSDPAVHEAAALIKGTLGILFPMNFRNRVDVNFGPSDKTDGDEFARPSLGNKRVIETDTIQLVYETLVKTLLMVNARGLSQEQCAKLVKTLSDKAIAESKTNYSQIQHTLIYKAVKGFIPLEYLEKPVIEKATERWKSTFEAMHRNTAACFLYVRYHIVQQIRYWTQIIEGNSQHFGNLGSKTYACTGSPYNAGTYPQHMQMLRDPTTLGEALHIIHQKCPPKGIHLLEAEQPEGVLDEILLSYFGRESTFGALIDGGALLTGLDNEKVARRMFLFCKEHRPEIKAVRFYKSDAQGNDELYCITDSKGEPCKYKSLVLPVKECIDYIDQVHGFGANNCPAGDGLETIGPHHPLYRWLQEVFRIRGLKSEQRVVEIDKIKIQIPQQHIHFVLTKTMQGMIARKLGIALPSSGLQLADLIKYALLNEAEIAEEENFHSMHDKQTLVIEQAIEDKILFTPDEEFEKILSLFKEFESILIQWREDNPIKLFALIKDKEDPLEALRAHAEKLYRVIDRSDSFTAEEKVQIRTDLFNLTLPPMPHQVTVWRKEKGGKIKEGTSEALGVEQTLQVSAQQQQETENELNQQQQNQLHTEAQKSSEKGKQASFWEWPPISDPASIRWLTFSDPSLKGPQSSWWNLFDKGKQEGLCPFFGVCDLLNHSVEGVLREVAQTFDRRLWMPNNFIARWVKARGETPASIGSRRQMDLFEVLVHLKETAQGNYEVLHMGPLQIHEAADWRKRLIAYQGDWTKQPIKTFLWDVGTRSLQAGCPLDAQKLRDLPDMQLLEGQLKFLNGDVSFAGRQGQMLKWIKEHDARSLEAAFHAIHGKRGIKTYQGSDLQEFFAAASQVDLDEII